jgi:hypothetical protein
MLAVSRLEADRRCHGLDMRSFLMLPMQRVTRYPLLVYAILDRTRPATEQNTSASRALHLASVVSYTDNILFVSITTKLVIIIW